MVFIHLIVMVSAQQSNHVLNLMLKQQPNHRFIPELSNLIIDIYYHGSTTSTFSLSAHHDTISNI